MSDAVVLAASAVTVIVLSLIAHLLGFRTKGRFADADAAVRAIRAVEPRVAVSDVVVDGGWAIAKLADGRLAVARALGDGATARILPATARPVVRASKTGVKVRAPALDLGFPGGVLNLPAAPAWLDAPAPRA